MGFTCLMINCFTFNYKESSKTISLDDIQGLADKAIGSDLTVCGAPKQERPVRSAGCSCFLVRVKDLNLFKFLLPAPEYERSVRSTGCSYFMVRVKDLNRRTSVLTSSILLPAPEYERSVRSAGCSCFLVRRGCPLVKHPPQVLFSDYFS